ncbi:hypothetical protein DV735_g65, partial [Chaetothyriales sp. CBS 134920]
MLSRLTSVFWWGKGDSNDGDRQQATVDPGGHHVGQTPRRKRSFDEIDQSCSELTLEDTDDDSTRPTKRLRPDDSDDDEESEQSTSVADSAGSHISAAQSNDHDIYQTRRFIAPPPAISKPNRESVKKPTIKLTPSPQQNDRAMPGRRLGDSQSIASQQTGASTTTSPHHRLDASELFEAERARRRAEAASLGPGSGSGITSPAEHELFTHLYMRGYDPLIPDNWMLDFRTLPLALFGDDDDNARASGEEKPLIHAMHGSDFRATKALRDLFDTGRNLRGKIQACSSHPSDYPKGLELLLRKAINNYMRWMLKDAGLLTNGNNNTNNHSSPSCLPVHRIVMRKPSQPTADLVNELETGLHALALRHRHLRRHKAASAADADDDDCSTVLPSIEIDDQNPDMGYTDMEANIHPSAPLPTLFGILLTHTMVEETAKKTPPPDDMSMRYVAKFDFSDSTMDVWNAFSVAIVCMIIRRVLLREQARVSSNEK